MSEIRVEIPLGDQVRVSVINTREDLRDDFKYFITQARNYKPDPVESGFLHQRFLRAALLSMFAYAEAVVNGWLHAFLDEHRMAFLFTRLQRDSLDNKIRVLQDSLSSVASRPNVAEAKQVRNLFVHFTPDREDEAFGKLSLELIESAEREFDRWMAEMESALGLPRHPDSRELIRGFVEGFGEVTKEANSDGGK